MTPGEQDGMPASLDSVTIQLDHTAEDLFDLTCFDMTQWWFYLLFHEDREYPLRLFIGSDMVP